MQEEQTFYPVTTEYFTACLPLLEKYFGITAGYFNKELSTLECCRFDRFYAGRNLNGG